MGLSFIQGTLRAETATARAFKRVNLRYGGRLKITAPYGAYRTRAQQGLLYRLYKSGAGSTAARPGTSNHEGGRAVDVFNWAQFPTLRALMAVEQFTPDPYEPWHYNYTGPAVRTAAEKLKALLPIPRRTTVSTLYRDDSTLVKGKAVNGQTLYALAGDGTGDAAWLEFRTYTFAQDLARVHGNSVPLSGGLFAEYKVKYTNAKRL